MLYYDKDGISLHWGDCLDVMQGFASQQFDAVIK